MYSAHNFPPDHLQMVLQEIECPEKVHGECVEEEPIGQLKPKAFASACHKSLYNHAGKLELCRGGMGGMGYTADQHDSVLTDKQHALSNSFAAAVIQLGCYQELDEIERLDTEEIDKGAAMQSHGV